MRRTFDKHFGIFFAETSKLDQKIQYHENRTYLFCLSILRGRYLMIFDAFLKLFMIAGSSLKLFCLVVLADVWPLYTHTFLK